MGAQTLLLPYVAQFYPSEIRATGAGSAIGIGRVVGIAGPVLGGVLMAAVSFRVDFLAFAIASLIPVITLGLVREKYGAYHRISSKQNPIANPREG
jgi:AAHS family benzoate transporter-like MFS transporter